MAKKRIKTPHEKIVARLAGKLETSGFKNANKVATILLKRLAFSHGHLRAKHSDGKINYAEHRHFTGWRNALDAHGFIVKPKENLKDTKHFVGSKMVKDLIEYKNFSDPTYYDQFKKLNKEIKTLQTQIDSLNPNKSSDNPSKTVYDIPVKQRELLEAIEMRYGISAVERSEINNFIDQRLAVFEAELEARMEAKIESEIRAKMADAEKRLRDFVSSEMAKDPTVTKEEKTRKHLKLIKQA